MRRIRADVPEYEMRNAVVRVATKPYFCDHFGCEPRTGWGSVSAKPEERRIQPGDQYAYLSHGLKICARHYEASDVVEVTP